MPYISAFHVVIQDNYYTRLKFNNKLIGYIIDFLVVLIVFLLLTSLPYRPFYTIAMYMASLCGLNFVIQLPTKSPFCSAAFSPSVPLSIVLCPR